MQQNLRTHYLLILDRSGSMESIRKAILGSVNEQIGQIAELQRKFPEQSFMVNLVTFNQESNRVLHDLPALQLRKVRAEEYVPDGMTALYDAMGQSIIELKSRIAPEIASNKASAVVVVFTDGHENASKEITYAAIQGIIGELDKDPNWTFSYVGSTIDAMEIAVSLNIRTENALSVDQAELSSENRLMVSRMEHYAMSKREGMIEKDFLQKRNISRN
jgi:hypothetical protein